ncbi:30S ribosomal protein S6 [Hydrogenibacillus schlegelii]|uniref:Small ribosomal subunit protein bS6 n=1 Tax=Hydrogenibacillus schlegelii TaxID=1484 RepID=A0A132N2C4_HYDSH|nr:30S ribosomal protein S6 [Hydrogenibacillus schlegelii]KWX04291.1 30S ribosomal protein S6 [Hydrogenibacillus schlegelii]MBE3563313.1 30S ribosomal protein S6 [Hydrogenibacillus schlegelii]MBT9282121.1 30S ribosomal protein S6 [Hydrogenibacillus schlegelii]OAR04159.1 30S ribosomal protein S6 [Hydrogenibacillus schlegelii]PTQ54500.1 MAG: SSU ribosomal protein S6p [Hydrogenibacillus schlegelii]
MRRYEVLFILRPDLGEEAVAEHRERLQEIIRAQGGEIEKVEDMGKRRLAYEIKKFREGIYTVIYFRGTPQTVKEVERVLGITEAIIRHLVVKHDDDAA